MHLTKNGVQKYDLDTYLVDIRSVVEIKMYIPKDLILNWGQTAMKIVPSSSWMMEKHGCKHVKICICYSAVFMLTLLGTFLPIQLIYQGIDVCLLSPFLMVGISHVLRLTGQQKQQ